MTERLSDPAHLRVLAHPTRLRILALLRELGPRTASGLTEHVDEAPGTLSYHLAKLAGAGLIREAPGTGDRRQRWWQASQPMTSWDDIEFSRDPAKLAASRDLSRTIMQLYAQQHDAYLAATPHLGPEWVDAGLGHDRRLRLTAEQLRGLTDDLVAVAEKWQAVSDEAADGAEDVFLLLQAYRSSL